MTWKRMVTDLWTEDNVADDDVHRFLMFESAVASGQYDDLPSEQTVDNWIASLKATYPEGDTGMNQPANQTSPTSTLLTGLHNFVISQCGEEPTVRRELFGPDEWVVNDSIINGDYAEVPL